MTLPGPSRTIIVEPIDVPRTKPAREPAEPRPKRAPAPAKPKPKPEKVPG